MVRRRNCLMLMRVIFLPFLITSLMCTIIILNVTADIHEDSVSKAMTGQDTGQGKLPINYLSPNVNQSDHQKEISQTNALEHGALSKPILAADDQWRVVQAFNNTANGSIESLPIADYNVTDVLTQYYHSLGLKVTNYNRPEYFQSLLTNSTKGTIGLMDNMFNASSVRPFIDIEYPAFNISMPRFITDEDRITFSRCPLYSALLESLDDPRRLIGHLEFILEGAAKEKYDCGWLEPLTQWRTKPDKYQTRYSDDLIIPILVPDSFAFQLFTNGVLPKLVQIYPLVHNKDIRFLLFKPRDHIIVDMLQAIGISSDRLLQYTNTRHVVSLRYQLNACVAPPLHPILWTQFRRMLGVNEHLQVSYNLAYVVLLSRANARNKGRNIQNNADVVSLLTQRYHSQLVVYDGSATLQQSMELFGRARVIIGVHGGAFFNMHFSPKETILVEYLAMSPNGSANPPFVAHGIVWVMANLIGHRYYRVVERPITNKGDLVINKAKLVGVLNEIDRMQGIDAAPIIL